MTANESETQGDPLKLRSPLIVFFALLAVSVLPPAEARGSSRPRQAEVPYQSAAVGANLITPDPAANQTQAYAYDCGRGIGCVLFRVKPGERSASFEVRDATGLPVYAEASSVGETLGKFCGKSMKPIDVRGVSTVFITILGGNCLDLMPSAPTTGTVQATFFTGT